MENQKQSRRLPVGLIAGISIAILAVGGGAAWWAKQSMTNANKPSIPSTPPQETVTEKPPQTEQPAKQEQVEVYWLSADDSSIRPSPSTISVPQTSNQQERLTSAFQNLLDGPKSDQPKDYTTTIPKGTKLLDLKIDQQGVHVNLSKEFTSGGGSTSMTGRVAQIIYTATSLDNNAKVWLNIEGKPLEAPLGGEGLLLEQPTNREDFKTNFQL